MNSQKVVFEKAEYAVIIDGHLEIDERWECEDAITQARECAQMCRKVHSDAHVRVIETDGNYGYRLVVVLINH